MSFPHPVPITGFVTRVTRRVSLVEQELLTSLPPRAPGFFFMVVVLISHVFSVVFIDHCVFFCPFSVKHCSVCPCILILPLSNLQITMLFGAIFSQ
jgi:hypothetical protein